MLRGREHWIGEIKELIESNALASCPRDYNYMEDRQNQQVVWSFTLVLSPGIISLFFPQRSMAVPIINAMRKGLKTKDMDMNTW